MIKNTDTKAMGKAISASGSLPDSTGATMTVSMKPIGPKGSAQAMASPTYVDQRGGAVTT